jgi:aspartate-semialdehyde dehydrogenase
MIVAPVFHCHAALLRVTTSRTPSASRILRALRSGGPFDVASPSDGPGDGRATPAEWAGEEKIRVAEIREDPRGASWIWSVADDLKAGAALNVVRIAESLLSGREMPPHRSG